MSVRRRRGTLEVQRMRPGGWLLLAAGAALSWMSAGTVYALEAKWIWDPRGAQSDREARICCFRKTFVLRDPESGTIEITCDERYELYVNGRKVGAGHDWKVLDAYDITPHLRSGRNVIAVLSVKESPGNAGMVARLTVKERGGTHVEHSSDSTWKSLPSQIPRWNILSLDDSRWNQAHEIGPLGQTPPWRGGQGSPFSGGRFTVLRGFRVESVLPADKTGSLLAMTFGEQGEILLSQENGPLLVAKDSNQDGIPDSVDTLCDLVKNCQGVLAHRGRVFVVGDGPEGAALYRLSDDDGDGRLETAVKILKFEDPIGEHAAHGITLGPDGLIYVIAGNHTSIQQEVDPKSPYHHFYDSDLVLPRYEDPGGHAAGRKAPGGFVARTDPEGSFVELFAGGIRNAYDLAFNSEGELFTFDSDMEWDMGLPWYRPTRILHLVPGGEYGWRSGWAKWPSYYVDSLPSVIDIGAGSPTGLVFYNHFAFPRPFAGGLFACDWAGGRILHIRLQRQGGSYRATSELFLAGRPLNVTDIEVGPEGWLYFCTGGRASEGGVFRIAWTGEIPDPQREIGTGITAAVRHPQAESAWGRQEILAIKTSLGNDWHRMLEGVARVRTNATEVRIQALHLMELVGPYPTPNLLLDLSTEPNEAVRAKIAFLMGLHASPETNNRLIEMMHDQNAAVRRAACEAAVRAGIDIPAARLLPMLGDRDRFVAWAACRALQQIPPMEWKYSVLSTDRHRQFVLGAVALLVGHPSHEHAMAVLEKAERIMTGPVKDEDFVDLLRVVQLAIVRGEVKPQEVPRLSQSLAEEFPASHHQMNREVMRLLASLGESAANPRIIAHLRAAIPDSERIHTAAYASFLPGWTHEERMALVSFLESARSIEGGHSLKGYLEAIGNDFAKKLSPLEREEVLSRATEWPVTALAVLSDLEGNITPQLVRRVIEQDRVLQKLNKNDEASRRLGIGFVAILAQSQHPEAMAYLRQSFDDQPERRGILAMGLAQRPDQENWDRLVQALPILEPAQAAEVLRSLAKVPRRPDKAEALRQTIMAGLKLKDQGALDAIRLLEHWTGRKLSSAGNTWQSQLAAWQAWFVEAFPSSPPPVVPESEAGQWTMDEILEYLGSASQSQADAARGEAVFEKALCVKCHRFGTRGEGMGPDLTTVARRFQRKEILESILFPSHVISDQYASRTVVTRQGATHTGIVAQRPDGGATVLVSTGEKLQLSKEDIDEIVPSNVSAMPEGLLDTLSLEEIGDLFAYLTASTVISARRPEAAPAR